jgi:hypothetical protein
MRMANDRGMRRVGRPGVEQRFQASGGTGKKERANGGGFGRHVIRVQQSSIVSGAPLSIAENPPASD